MTLLAERADSPSVIGEKALRRQIDRSVTRALVDPQYAALLLTDPTVALEDHGCSPQQYKSLRSIQATDLIDFARQARSLFWIVAPKPICEEAELSLAVAAAR
jgi:hypothetical protein